MNNQSFNRLALLALLKKLFKNQGYFSPCDFDKCIELAGIALSKEERLPFQALHCVDYGDMPLELRRELFERVRAILRRNPDPEFIFPELDAPIQSVLPKPEKPRRLFGLLPRV
jgi:hypothetical protein